MIGKGARSKEVKMRYSEKAVYFAAVGEQHHYSKIYQKAWNHYYEDLGAKALRRLVVDFHSI